MANATVALAAIGFAIAEGAIDGYPVGWLFVALIYAYSSADQYWKLVHEEADQESKWAWRRWQEAEYERRRAESMFVLDPGVDPVEAMAKFREICRLVGGVK
jgi:nicotinamide mononucleotide (NMN) deamidase PncC